VADKLADGDGVADAELTGGVVDAGLTGDGEEPADALAPREPVAGPTGHSPRRLATMAMRPPRPPRAPQHCVTGKTPVLMYLARCSCSAQVRHRMLM
jgi:hypothetical protein